MAGPELSGEPSVRRSLPQQPPFAKGCTATRSPPTLEPRSRRSLSLGLTPALSSSPLLACRHAVPAFPVVRFLGIVLGGPGSVAVSRSDFLPWEYPFSKPVALLECMASQSEWFWRGVQFVADVLGPEGTCILWHVLTEAYNLQCT